MYQTKLKYADKNQQTCTSKCNIFSGVKPILWHSYNSKLLNVNTI